MLDSLIASVQIAAYDKLLLLCDCTNDLKVLLVICCSNILKIICMVSDVTSNLLEEILLLKESSYLKDNICCLSALSVYLHAYLWLLEQAQLQGLRYNTCAWSTAYFLHVLAFSGVGLLHVSGLTSQCGCKLVLLQFFLCKDIRMKVGGAPYPKK